MARNLSELAGRVFPTTMVGSYPRPSWFTRNLQGMDVLEALRDEDFADAYRDAIRAMIGDQTEAGLDVLCDGHLWYDRHQGFIASFLLYNLERTGGIEVTPTVEKRHLAAAFVDPDDTSVPDDGMSEVADVIFRSERKVTGPLQRGPARHALNWTLAQRCTDKPVKAQFACGPNELAVFLRDEHYRDRRALVREWAEIYRAEIQDSVAAGARIVQFDDLFFITPEDDWPFCVEIINRILEGVDAYKIWHACHGGTSSPIGTSPYVKVFPYLKELQVDSIEWAFAETGFPDEHLKLFSDPSFDKDLGMGVVSIKHYVIESPEQVADAIRKAIQYIGPERLHLTTDCGLFAFSRPAAKAKLAAMVGGAKIVRAELG
jgi:5-methyltetrahydropteroyltriglutamate--homocysteine methyltransferase